MDVSSRQQSKVSFEFFPPRTVDGQAHLMDAANQLLAASPKFFSVTYGAGGSTQEHTLETVVELKKNTQVETVPHLSCVASTSSGIREMLAQYKTQGIQRIVVLRGDLPSGMGSFVGEFAHAYELVAFIRAETGDHFFIEVAAYPELHPETLDTFKNLEHFKQKIAAGANSAITQYFYNSDAYFYFLDACEKLQINIPIVPGIMPITQYEQLARFSKLCGAEIPRWIRYQLESFGKDLESLKLFGEEVVTDLCAKLLKGGAPGLHFFTINKAEPSLKILSHLENIYE
jgi:methylenetetrahydrofolate reductase (NADPH)